MPAIQHKNLLIVFAKPPVAGQSKTRLIPELGERGAAQFHAQMVLQTLNNVCGSDRWNVQLWAANGLMPEFFQQCARNFSLDVHYQQGDDLGERMYHAIKESLLYFDKVSLIGTDCPGINKAVISETFSKLNNADLLITPAEDGGYVQIAARKILPQVFINIEWGSEKVMLKTLQNLDQLPLSRTIGEPLWDIDTPKDLKRYHEEYQALASVFPPA